MAQGMSYTTFDALWSAAPKKKDKTVKMDMRAYNICSYKYGMQACVKCGHLHYNETYDVGHGYAECAWCDCPKKNSNGMYTKNFKLPKGYPRPLKKIVKPTLATMKKAQMTECSGCKHPHYYAMTVKSVNGKVATDYVQEFLKCKWCTCINHTSDKKYPKDAGLPPAPKTIKMTLPDGTLPNGVPKLQFIHDQWHAAYCLNAKPKSKEDELQLTAHNRACLRSKNHDGPCHISNVQYHGPGTLKYWMVHGEYKPPAGTEMPKDPILQVLGYKSEGVKTWYNTLMVKQEAEVWATSKLSKHVYLELKGERKVKLERSTLTHMMERSDRLLHTLSVSPMKPAYRYVHEPLPEYKPIPPALKGE